MKKIIIAGGTGFIGSYLSKLFFENGFEVLIVSRSPEHVPWKLKELTEALEGAEMIINLAGRSINCRYNDANRKAIIESRITATNLIGNAVAACKNPPKLWINASASGIYKPSLNHPVTEEEKELGNDFLAEVVTKWENVFFDFQISGTRKVALRTSVVLGKNGGALQPFVWLSRFGLGGKQASGKQMFSWIHIEDYFRILLFFMDQPSIHGIINCTSPNPVANKEFMHSIRKTLGVPFGIPAPKFAVELGATIIGTEPELILNSSFVMPKRLTELGFQFVFPEIDQALENLLK
jgi:hypothetical protein